MSSANIIKVRNGQDERSIALYSGIGIDELVNLLTATFGIYGNSIVGFLTEVRFCD